MNRKQWLITGIVILMIFSAFAMYKKIISADKTYSFEELSGKEAMDRIKKKENMILLYSSKDCKACRVFSPILENVAKDFNVKIYLLDADKQSTEKIATAYNLYVTPTILSFKQGSVDRYENARGEQEVRDIVKKWSE
ncbi:thioredoxin family protein [Candidatus Enterococcus mansonii]|uniref:Thioredoxin domain-containing protein n=1 Tax=Candidatus Enterococcus mansonii TaxID=1834181 RepID=A0A242CEE9_9ENTE|nr:thioredoxin family protein [Enterococcus sp. 4G2_DIV0659]OTO08586.1 hypothetical protein A5880_001586 [Enterococcus sp. 4G2_DIV0659]